MNWERRWCDEIKLLLISSFSTSINPDASNWILTGFPDWSSLEDLEKCDDLTGKQIKLLQSKLKEIFEDFFKQKHVLLERLKCCGIPDDIVQQTAIVTQFAKGNSELMRYLNSSDFESQFSDFQLCTLKKCLSDLFEPDTLVSEEPDAKLRKIDSEHCLKNIRDILELEELPEEAVNEVMDRVQYFDDLKCALESCENLSRNQIKILSDKLESIFSMLRRSSAEFDVSILPILKELALNEDAIIWMKNWLRSFNHKDPDLSELELCDDLTKRQLESLTNRLMNYFKPNQMTSTKNCALDPHEKVLREVNELLETQSSIDNLAHEWIMSNIPNFDNLDELQNCPDLTPKQVRQLMEVLKVSFETYRSSTVFTDHEPPQSDDLVLKSSTESNEINSGSSSSSSTQSQFPMDIDSCEIEVTITPLILIDPQIQEGVSVEKFVLSEAGVKRICNLVPEELVGETPVYYESIFGGPTIQFDVLNQLQIQCIGLFGPLKAILHNLNHVVHESKVVSFEESIVALKSGLYLIDFPRTESKFLIFRSENDVDFNSVKKDSRAVHFLRYMSQLCNNVVMCLDGKYEDRLSTDVDKVIVRNDRRNRYNLKKHEVQQESFSLQDLGTKPIPFDNIFSSDNGLVAANFETINSYPKKEQCKKTGDLSTVLKFVNDMVVEDFEKIDYNFKKEYLKKFKPERWSEMEKNVSEEMEKLQKEHEENAEEVVRFSVAVHFCRELGIERPIKMLNSFFAQNKGHGNNLWPELIKFSNNSGTRMKSISEVLSQEEQCELRRSIESATEEVRLFDKYLLWTELQARVDGSTENAIKYFTLASWSEMKELSLTLSLRSRIMEYFNVYDFRINRILVDAESKVDYLNASDDLKLCADMYLCYLLQITEKFTTMPLFIAFRNAYAKHNLIICSKLLLKFPASLKKKGCR